jgi:acyl transferase domain-containing protein/acyl carrier protein
MNNDFLDRISQLSPKKLALLAMDLQAKLEANQKEKSEPIAIIGMGCRFPGGANDPEAYWQLLREGRDAIREIPKSRWNIDDYYDPDPEAPGKMATRWGGFIDEVDQFDPQFFGISPREAVSMDPQQRLLLEVTWQALEYAGYSPDQLFGSRTGAFIGICNHDYSQLLITPGSTTDIDVYTATGSAFSIASGRLSYVLGLHGPSISIDTACSSSLVAVHLAIQSLRNKECEMALAAGVNLILWPETTIILSQSKMLSSDGRCKAFDSRADGFVRSEGCGVVVLKRLADAVADGDSILAIIRGSAINQDGRSNGITAPNGPSQEAVIRAALKNAGVETSQIGYIETHGTGTSLGDPIEIQALGKILREGHLKSNPVIIGSVKTNLGHMESAAGVAGLIKLVLTLQHGEVPPHLHLQKPNPYIAWDEYPVTIPATLTPFGGKDGRRFAGISSFGFSGTNVHMVLENADKRKIVPLEAERPTQIFTLSAKSELALKESATRFKNYLTQHPGESLADICYTTNVGRSHFKYRLAIVANELKDLRDTLGLFDAGKQLKNLFSGQMQGNRPPQVVFMFTGQGAQYANMGRRLYESQPIFRKTLEQCDELLRPHMGASLLDILYGESSALIDDIAYAQPVLFAFQYALVQLWKSWGIKPATVIGHSAGEYVAACVAGVFSLEDGLKLASARGRLMKSTPAGTMVNIFTTQERVTKAISPYGDTVSIAAVNGPENIVISGDETHVQLISEQMQAENIKVQSLNISIAGHSPLMDSIHDEFKKVADAVTYRVPQIDFVSGLNGLSIQSQQMNAGYWCNHMRATVQFYPMITALQKSEHRIFVEIGPAPILTGMAQQCLSSEASREITWVSSLRPKYEDWTQILKGLGALYSQGVNVDWNGFEDEYVSSRQRIPLPTYPFQRSRFWARVAKTIRPILDPSLHPLLGKQMRSPVIQDIVFESQMNASLPAFLSHHRIFGVVVLPSPCYLEMALQATQEAFGKANYSIQDFSIQQALILPEEGIRTVQLILTPEEAQGSASFRVVSWDETTMTWTVHANGRVALVEEKISPNAPLDLATIQTACPDEISSKEFYEKVIDLGLEFGPAFRGLTKIWKGNNEALGLMQLPKTLIAESSSYQIHPAFLDSCFHLLGAPLGEVDTAFLLIGLDRFQLYRAPDATLWNHTVLHQKIGTHNESFTGSVRIFNETGDLVAEIEGLHLRRAEREMLLKSVQKSDDDWFYQVAWEPKPLIQIVSAERSADHLLKPKQIAQKLAPVIPQLSKQFELAAYRMFLLDIDKLVVFYIVDALQKSGLMIDVGSQISMNDVARAFGLPEQHYLRRLFTRLVGILSEKGILAAREIGWEWVKTPDQLDAEHYWTDLLTKYPAQRAELTLIKQCGPFLAEVLHRAKTPLDLLFPEGSIQLTEKIYQDAPFAQAYNKLAQQSVQVALSQISKGQTIRILEIGAGSGGTTNAILPILDASHTEYVFTDLSSQFTRLASQKFSHFPFVRYELLDIERDPSLQGFGEQQFDLILAANVLHATSDLMQSLKHIRELLAPGGMLVLLEGTAPQSWVDITFGLTEGWWKFSDMGLRPSYPLLSQQQWLSFLNEVGFSESVAIPSDNEQMLEQAVIVSQNKVVGDADWLIFIDEAGVGKKLGQLLQQRGQHVVLVSPGSEYKELSKDHLQIDPSDKNDFKRLLVETSNRYEKIIHLWSLDESVIDPDDLTWEPVQTFNCATILHLIQVLTENPRAKMPSLWMVTQNAQPINVSAASSIAITQTPLWGLGRVMALEHPELWGGLIDLDPKADTGENASHLISELLQSDGEDQIGWRDRQRYVIRLTRIGQPAPVKSIDLKSGAYLITGGLGGLGLKVAHWLVEQGARYLVLTSRHGLPERAKWALLSEDHPAQEQVRAIQMMEKMGATVIVESADVGDMVRMKAIFQYFGNNSHPLRGVIHAAADLSNWKLKSMPLEALQSMFQSKVTGTWVLHQLTKEMDLDFFVLFSSTTALWGSNDLAHYAAANSFLDGFAHYRKSCGLPAISINWGTWDRMRVANTGDQKAVSGFGLKQMSSEHALAILNKLINTNLSQFVVASVDWNVLKPVYEIKRNRPFLEHVGKHESVAVKPSSQKVSDTRSEFLTRFQTIRPADRSPLMIEFVRDQVCLVLDFASGQMIDIQQGLFEMGLDSLMAIELKNLLETGIEQSLPSTLIFNYPTIKDIAKYLETRLESIPKKTHKEISFIPADTTKAAVTDASDLSEDELADILMNKLKKIE